MAYITWITYSEEALLDTNPLYLDRGNVQLVSPRWVLKHPASYAHNLPIID